MKFVTLDSNQDVKGEGRADSTVEAPDHVGIGWHKNGEDWEKSATLLVEEAAAAAAAATEAQIQAGYDAMLAGTGTTGERAARMEKAICYIAKHVLRLVD